MDEQIKQLIKQLIKQVYLFIQFFYMLPCMQCIHHELKCWGMWRVAYFILKCNVLKSSMYKIMNKNNMCDYEQKYLQFMIHLNYNL